ncbi:benzoate-CoA ligase family protein [Pararhodospirillum oryzae]|uniref:Acetyl-CoA synthetase n=1 Tax=Pararhodospirillum oryzae TaxID=478448 RepID=A0A512H5X4_9PROT|nr:benzoate-CoA ligase family protein [Pararhodospirillum oryzae]GEO80831.1 acetyl-CoA synthetase [Pararhodospirillum oryzae]
MMTTHAPHANAMPGEDLPPGFNAARVFIDRHLAEGRATRPALCSLDQVLTYEALAHGVNRAAHGLVRLGLVRGDRLLLVIRDEPAFYFLFWGAMKAGIIPVPVNTLLRAPDYAFMIDHSGCRGLIWSDACASDVTAALSLVPDALPVALPVSEAAPLLFEHGPDTFDAVDAGPEAPCLWLYSSGSTGRPKAVVHAHRDLVATAELYGVRTLGLRADDICFSAAKLFFAYGLGNAMTFPLWVGGTAVLLAERPTPSNTFAMIERFRPSVYFGVPTLYAALLEALKTRSPDLSSLRLCVSAGEALPPDLFHRWHAATGLAPLDGIGSTEALHIFISNRLDRPRPGTSGCLVEGFEARIVDDGDHPVPVGEVGRLLIRGPSLTLGYWRGNGRLDVPFERGWLDTGDTYSCDAEGYFTYHGRSDDMLKVGGIWCSPFEIEGALIEHPSVLEVAVVGREDAHGLVKPEAWVVPTAGVSAGPLLEAALQAHCKTRLAPYKYPRTFHFVEDLPKTATGKIQRFRLRRGDGWENDR